MRPTLIAGMKILCVAEKNSIAKSVANALGGGQVTTRSSPDKYVKNYDFNFNFPEWGSCQVTITSVRGHLTELVFPDAYKKWEDPPPSELFRAQVNVIVSKDMSKVESNIKKESRNSDKLFIWTDCDREGEHIGHEIVSVARSSNRRLQNADIKRANFNNTDPQHLRSAALRPQNMDMRQVDAVEARREFDLRTGFAFTRFQTTLLKKSIPALQGEKPISYGSCQFPTLGFVVDRYKRVKNFVSEPFWSIDLKLNAPNAAVLNPNWERHHLFDRMATLLIYEKCMEGEKFATAVSVRKSRTSKWRPLPLTTVQLQKLGASYLKISSKKVMDIAESLYNQGLISYPRTETDQFNEAINLEKLVKSQERSQIWGNYARSLTDEGKFKTPRKGKHDDKAHPPIHPIRAAARSELKDEASWKVYEFITRHFLACCSDDAKGDSTQITFDWNGEKFMCSGIRVLERNFLDVYPYFKWTDSELPPIEQGAKLAIKSAMMKEGKTNPPNYLTEPELIALMDANGIGTDATMAEHIEKILTREYVMKHKTGARGQEYLIPSNLGMMLYEAYDQIGLDLALTKPFLRKETEKMMNDICQGTLSKQEFLNQAVLKYSGVYNMVYEQRQTLINTARNYLTS